LTSFVECRVFAAAIFAGMAIDYKFGSYGRSMAVSLPGRKLPVFQAVQTRSDIAPFSISRLRNRLP
jgi:hypothetical protein